MSFSQVDCDVVNSFFPLYHNVASILYHAALIHHVLLQLLLHVFHFALCDDLLIVEQILEGIFSLTQYV